MTSTFTSSIVRSYSALLLSEKAIVGGKAWAVAMLSQANIPVPAGFCVTSGLTGAMLGSDQKLEKDYAIHLDTVDSSGVPDRALAARLKHRIDRLSVQRGSVSELSSALENHIPRTSSRIIVRSSASVEDSKRTSFAGQFASHTAENNTDAVIAAIKKCWLVIVSPSLAAYAFAMKAKLSGVSFAFLVQEFLEFDYAGVLFTRVPDSSSSKDYLVEYAEGGAQQVVGGSVIPARCRLVKGTQDVTWLNENTRVGRVPDQTLLHLGHLARNAKTVFRSDQDIEWGIRGTDVFLLQSRPITGVAASA